MHAQKTVSALSTNRIIVCVSLFYFFYYTLLEPIRVNKYELSGVHVMTRSINSRRQSNIKFIGC